MECVDIGIWSLREREDQILDFLAAWIHEIRERGDVNIGRSIFGTLFDVVEAFRKELILGFALRTHRAMALESGDICEELLKMYYF